MPSRFAAAETWPALVAWAKGEVSAHRTFLATVLFGVRRGHHCLEADPRARALDAQRGWSGCDVSGSRRPVSERDAEARRLLSYSAGCPARASRTPTSSEVRALRLRALGADQPVLEPPPHPSAPESIPEVGADVDMAFTNEISPGGAEDGGASRGGGCPLHGLPMLQGFNDSLLPLIADFLGVHRGRPLRHLRELAELKQAAMI
jgi:hypothetical protein